MHACLLVFGSLASAELSAQMVPLGVWPDPLGFNTCLLPTVQTDTFANQL